MIRQLLVIFCMAVSACAQPMNPNQIQPSKTPGIPSSTTSQTTANAVSTTPVPTRTTASPTSTPVPQITPTPAVRLCSPLADIRIPELVSPDLLKNPFQLPREGMDDGHHGVDFAYWSRGDRKSMLGHPVLSVLAGRVAGIVHNRQPYGFAVIVETPLDWLPHAWIERLSLPEQVPTIQPPANLYCPAGDGFRAGLTGQRSLYLLYAHLNQLPEISIDQNVQCGQPIGEVGTTGKSINLHLHLETRVGPSEITMPEMAHYENGATNEEMQAYCAWRVSSLFQMFDPLTLLQVETLQP